MKPTKIRPRGGVLTVISLLMIGSAILRVGFEAGPALARSDDPKQAKQPSTGHNQANAADLQVLLTELLRRKEQLDIREDAILGKENVLEIANQALSARLTALQGAEENLRQTLAIADKAAENDLVRLTDVYQNMKPKDAATLFETMDPVFAAGFLSRMPPEAAAGVMAGLSAQAAYTISVVMAGRNALAPLE